MAHFKHTTDAFRIEFYMMETKTIDDGTELEQRRFYISPVYDTIEQTQQRIDDLKSDPNFIDGVVISLKKF